MTGRRFVLLDRDGTIIVEKHYLSDPDGLELLPGAAEGLRRLAGLGLGLAVVTNQSPIGRGLFDVATLDRIHARLTERLAEQGVRLDGIYYCPHTPDDGCDCRKPRTGMARRAGEELGFDPASAFVVGDMESDMNLGKALGATTFLVRSGYGARTLERGLVTPDHVVDGLLQAADVIEGLL
jgi:histidinol-phosphate phosphatase family protein